MRLLPIKLQEKLVMPRMVASFGEKCPATVFEEFTSRRPSKAMKTYKLRQIFVQYRGSVLWNKIPSEIRNLSSLKQFKTSLNGKAYF